MMPGWLVLACVLGGFGLVCLWVWALMPTADRLLGRESSPWEDER